MKIEFEAREIGEVFDAIANVACKVKALKALDKRATDANDERFKLQEKLQKKEQEYYQKTKELEEDHKAELKALRDEINKLKEKKVNK